MPSDKSYSAAVTAAIRWISQNLVDGEVRQDCLFDYYQRNGGVSGLSIVSRRGAAGSMYWRLVDAGLIDHGSCSLTGAGSEVAR